MEKIHVLIADDSVIYRSQIRAALQDLPFVEVVGAASNGRLALERIEQSKVDLLILDLEMPEMDGKETLREIKKRGYRCKILMFSSCSKRGAEITLEALEEGANDFIPKPSADSAGVAPTEKIRQLLEPKNHALFPKVSTAEIRPPARPSHKSNYPEIIWDLFHPEVVVIGSSTGGPTVLERIFSQLLPPFSCPIIIAQHMPPLFTATLAERLSKLSGIPAREAGNGETLVKNVIYIAPGDYHLKLDKEGNQVKMYLDQSPQINSVRPAVDPLFTSAARIYKARCLGIVLTGMGYDGKTGSQSIKENGGAVVIQEEKSCVVFGMPGAVYECGAYDKIATPEQIIKILNEKIGFSR